MSKDRHIGQYQRNFNLSYPLSLGQRLYSIFWGPFLVVVILAIILAFLPHSVLALPSGQSLGTLVLATMATLLRLVVAYILAVIVALPLALLATKNPFTEKVFLPIFDVLESIPILAFFPVLVLVFVKLQFVNGAAIFILFLSMLWNIVFTVVGGLKIIPREIKWAARVFGLRGFEYFRQVILPAIFPQIVTGSILAFAQGWNIIIVAEVLHTYVPGGLVENDLFGIGSILVSSAAHGQTALFIASVIVMVLVIALLNFFVWQKLLRYAERFKFE